MARTDDLALEALLACSFSLAVAASGCGGSDPLPITEPDASGDDASSRPRSDASAPAVDAGPQDLDAGTQDVDAGQCTWSGGIKDLATTTAWTTSGEVTLAPGSATFPSSAYCVPAAVRQTFPSPELTCAERLLMTLRATQASFAEAFLAVGINGGWNLLPLTSGTKEFQLCLGARGLAGSADLSIGPMGALGQCPPQHSSVALEHVSIAVDDSARCPLFGTAVNGNFESGTSGWTFKPGEYGGTAGVATGIGEGASQALRLTTAKLCSEPSATGMISIPTPEMIPNPALRIWARGTPTQRAEINIGGARVQLEVKAQPERRNICLPRWTLGTVQPITIAFARILASQTCERDNPRELVVDNLELVSEPTCANDALQDPGFEQALNAAPAWTVLNNVDHPTTKAEIVSDPGQAHTGSGFARFSSTMKCQGATIEGNATVPSPTGPAGPALKFSYKTNAIRHSSLLVSMLAMGNRLTLGASPTWKQVTACLHPRAATRPDKIIFTILGAPGTCSDTYPIETYAIDDVELTTDASCPAQ